MKYYFFFQNLMPSKFARFSLKILLRTINGPMQNSLGVWFTTGISPPDIQKTSCRWQRGTQSTSDRSWMSHKGGTGRPRPQYRTTNLPDKYTWSCITLIYCSVWVQKCFICPIIKMIFEAYTPTVYSISVDLWRHPSNILAAPSLALFNIIHC